MRASRLLSILILLQLRERLTAEALAAEFEVSVRTIYRDIERLAEAGVPVYAERGPGGGFRLVDGYRTRLTGLGADEAEAMFMIGLPGPAQALGLGAAATGAGRKLLASLPRGWDERAGRMSDRFHLDPADWYRDEDPLPQLPALARAVLDRHPLTMTYESWTAVRAWTVEPLGLVLKAGAWYLVATGGGKTRIFRVSNIRALAVDADANFERPPDFDLAAWWAADVARFEAGLRPGRAELRLTAAGLKFLSEQGAYARRAVAEALPDTDGWSRAILPIEHVEQAARLVLGLGPEAQVLAPDELRARVHEMAREIAQRHADVAG
ncbi:MAG: helix-turn-helix transcriptional regulator [Pseudomonadota bacterium]